MVLALTDLVRVAGVPGDGPTGHGDCLAAEEVPGAVEATQSAEKARSSSPSARWTAQQVVEALPWGASFRYLLRDRDRVYGDRFRQRVEGLGLEEIVTSYQSPWQNSLMERLIGSLRRECLDHLIVLNESHLRRALSAYLSYYHHSRAHMFLDMDCPERRRVQGPKEGEVVEIPEVFGLHHRYERRAA